MNARPDSNTIFIQSKQIELYENKENRKTFESFYDSERHSFDYVLPKCSSVIDVGCLNGDTLNAVKGKYNLKCRGIDIDKTAIDMAKKRYKGIDFVVGDFMDPSFTCEKADVVYAFNLFDHFTDWKAALRGLKRLSNRFINVGSLIRLNGPTLTDPETNFLYYSGERLVWVVHNIFELAAYAGTEHINATSIYAYCYPKYNKYRFNNLDRLANVSHAMNPGDILVGNIIIEFDDKNGMQKTKCRPDLKVIVNDEIVFDSPWKKS